MTPRFRRSPRSQRSPRSSGSVPADVLPRPRLSRAEAWREVGLTTAVLWVMLGAGCFCLGGQWVYDTRGISLNGAFVLDLVFLAGVAVVIGFVWWRQRRAGEGLAQLGLGCLTRTSTLIIAVVYGLLWTAMSYARGGDPLAWSWQRPIMMVIGVVLAFGEEIAVRGLVLDRLERCGTGRMMQVVVTGVVMGVYHGVVGYNLWPSYMVTSFVLFGLLSVICIHGGRSLTPCLLAHAMTHVLGDPTLMQGILYGVGHGG